MPEAAIRGWGGSGSTAAARVTELEIAKALACALILVASLAVPVGAEESGEEHPPAHESGEHEFHRHHLSVFLGVTEGEVEKEAEAGGASEEGAVILEEESAFTVGLDYEYRLNRRWGVGALIDFAGELRSFVGGVPVVLHPGGAWKLLLAPGFEKKSGQDVEFLMRVGAMYDFEVGRFTIAPAINVDFVDDEEILVYGVNIGRGF